MLPIQFIHTMFLPESGLGFYSCLVPFFFSNLAVELLADLLFLIKFCRIRPAGEPPSPRAAHAAAAVGTMVVFQVCKTAESSLKIAAFISFYGVLVILLVYLFHWLGWNRTSWSFY